MEMSNDDNSCSSEDTSSVELEVGVEEEDATSTHEHSTAEPIKEVRDAVQVRQIFFET
jgi:hypothetical protein